MNVTVRHAKRYRAHIHLGFFEQVVSDAAIKEKFEAVGFQGVSVVGEGRERWAFGTWPGADTTAEMPEQVTEAVEI